MISSTQNQSPNYMDSSGQPDSEILPLLMLLWARKFFIAGFLVVGCIIGVASALSKNSVYQADALIQLETKKSGITLSENISDLMSNESDAITEIEILKSRMVLSETIREQQLDVFTQPKSMPVIANLFSLTGMSIPEWEWLSSYGLRGESLTVESLSVAEEMLGKQFTVTRIDTDRYQVVIPNGESFEGFIGKEFVHPDGQIRLNITEISAKPGVEFYISKVPELIALNNLRTSLSVIETGRNSNLLVITLRGSNLAVSKSTLDQILQTYVTQNIGRSSEEAERSLDFLEKQLPIVLNDLSVAENDLNEFRLDHESINLDLESASVLERMVAIDTQISELSMQEAELSRLYTTAHPRYAALLSKRSKLIAEKETLSAAVQTFPETQQEILKRTRNLEVNQHIYLQLLNKKQELNVLKASTVGSVRIIDKAAANPRPIGPNKPMIVAMWAFLLSMVGCGIVLLRSFLERNVDSPEDISKLGLPVYATVPKSVSQDGQFGKPYILSRDNPAELAVEALRSLRTSLHFGMLKDGKGVVSITGPAPEIGKSFVAANLAFLCAESGSSVLLIDADMRRGTIARIFGIEKNTEGLSELLAGNVKLEQAINRVAITANAEEHSEAQHRTLEPELEAVLEGIDLLESNGESLDGSMPSERGMLSVLPRGKAPPNPSELLMQDRLPNLLKEAAQSFDLVIVDTPPVLAATDAMIVGRYADMNLMVVRHSQTGVREMEEVVKGFHVNSVDLSGVILNGYDPKNGKYGHYGQAYGYQYQYQTTD